MNSRDVVLTEAAGQPEPRVPAWRRGLRRLRAVHEAQVQLWEHAQHDLEPWRDCGPLRWRRDRLDGVLLPDDA